MTTDANRRPEMMSPAMEARFSQHDVANLRAELLDAGLDSWQAAELIASFLAVRGYGVSAGEAREAVARFEGPEATVQAMHRDLEQMARAT